MFHTECVQVGAAVWTIIALYQNLFWLEIYVTQTVRETLESMLVPLDVSADFDPVDHCRRLETLIETLRVSNWIKLHRWRILCMC